MQGIITEHGGNIGSLKLVTVHRDDGTSAIYKHVEQTYFHDGFFCIMSSKMNIEKHLKADSIVSILIQPMDAAVEPETRKVVPLTREETHGEEAA